MIGQLLDRRYRITETIGTAEFGQIYLAKDTHRPGHPECFVKHLKPSANDVKLLETARRLFDKEAEILEKLGQHEQIPQLFAYFEENKEFYLVEEFVPGHSLAEEILPGKPLAENQVMTLLREVLEILVFVHKHGVIHRDIKPSNLIRRHPDGKLVLIDFGAVKEIGTQFSQSQMPPTMRIGTMEYMPVEQFQYNPQLNSDIYALGMIGIQALTGLPIYDLPKLRDPKHLHNGDIVWRHLAIVGVEFADILDKMVRHDYRQRYQSSSEVLADLIKIGDRSGIRVPKLMIYREEVERRASSRGEVSVVGRSILDALRNSLELEAEEAEKIEEEVLKPYRNYQEKIAQYQKALVEARKQENPLSQETLEELKRLQQVLDLKDDDISKIENKVAVKSPGIKLSPMLPNWQNAGRWLAIGGASLLGIAVLWGLMKFVESTQRRQGLEKQLSAIESLSKERNYEKCIEQANSFPQNSRFYYKSQQVLKQCEAGINWKNAEVKTLTGHTDAVGSVAFRPDGKLLATGSRDKTVKIWNLAKNEVISNLDGDKGAVWTVAFSPDSQQLAIGSFFWRILLFNIATGDLVRSMEHDAAVWSVAFSPNGKNLATGSEDKKIKVWNLETGRPVYTLNDHADYVYSIAVSADGKTMVSGSRDGTVKIWEFGTGTLLHNLSGHLSDVRAVAITADGKTVVSGSYDKTLKVWNAETGDLIRTIEGHSDQVVGVAISPDGKIIASASKDKTVKLWNLESGSLINTLEGHSDEVYTVAFSPDGKTIASGGKDNTLKLWIR
ncbi:MAG TPA: serine/threonine-protein kinase [Halomicronema sp.]